MAKLTTVLAFLLYAVNQAQLPVSAQEDIACIPNRCKPADFNRKRDISERAAPSGPATSDITESKSKSLKKTLDHFVRHNNKPAEVFRATGNGIANVYKVVLFNKDQEGKDSFGEKYKDHVSSKIPLSDTIIYIVRADAKTLQAICAERAVAFIEQNAVIKPAACGKQVVFDHGIVDYNSSWGLSRLDETGADIDDVYDYDTTPEQAQVFTYVVDTGIKSNPSEYGSRLSGLSDQSNSNNPLDDVNGHGTHVAGTMGSLTYGVAKMVKVFSARISDDVDGSSTEADILQAYQDIMDHVKTNNKANKAVVNISFGGGASRTENLKIKDMTDEGITVVAAAGNEKSDSCCTSPAGSTAAISVGCTDEKNIFCSFSNWGPCVDINAPGDTINSLGKSGEKVDMSGTSMSSPHVAGVAAILIARKMPAGLTPAQVKAQLLSTSISGLVKNIIHPHITTDKLLYLKCSA